MRYLNGNCSNPTTVGLKSAFKKLLCHRISDSNYRNANCEPEESEESHELIILDQPAAGEENGLCEGTIDNSTIEPTQDGEKNCDGISEDGGKENELGRGTIDNFTIDPIQDCENSCKNISEDEKQTKKTLEAVKTQESLLIYKNNSFHYPKRQNKIPFNRRNPRKRPYDTTKTKVDMSFKRKEYDVEKILMNNCAKNDYSIDKWRPVQPILEIVKYIPGSVAKFIEDLVQNTFSACPKLVLGTDGSTISDLARFKDYYVNNKANLTEASWKLYVILMKAEEVIRETQRFYIPLISSSLIEKTLQRLPRSTLLEEDSKYDDCHTKQHRFYIIQEVLHRYVNSRIKEVSKKPQHQTAEEQKKGASTTRVRMRNNKITQFLGQ